MLAPPLNTLNDQLDALLERQQANRRIQSPTEWLNDVKEVTDETLLALTEHLPAEAAEALLELATGGKPRISQPAVVAVNPFDHPDAQRRFRVMANVEELRRALDFPWEKWAVFLHPEQRQWVERDYAGPARVSGSAALSKNKNVVFDFAVVDEAQDIGVAHLRFLTAFGGDRPNALFFAGDLGQRIFQQPFSWKALGVDVRGRSRTLRVNYRTSHQIRTQADRLLGPSMTDADGNSEDRSDTVSVFNGPPPTICSLKSEGEEIKTVGDWIKERAKAGVLPHEFGVFVRSAAQLDRGRAAAKEAGMAFKVLDEHVETTSGHMSISTMHLAKGLEFRAAVLMACDDEIIPLQERIETVGDDADLRDVYDTERHLLYVSCTRARDHLLVTSVEPTSEFIDDMQA